MDLNDLTLDDIFTTITAEAFNYSRSSRKCSGLSDDSLINYCCKRVLGDFKSGRDFLQFNIETGGDSFASSTVSDALKSPRRLKTVKEVNGGVERIISRLMNELKVDYLADFDYLDEYEVYAGDGHFIEHASHTKTYDSKAEQRRAGKLPKLHAAGTLYLQNLRNGLLKSYSPVTDGTRKSHEMPVFRDAYNSFSENIDNRKVIFVLDRAYPDHNWWMQRMREGCYFISRAKSSFKMQLCGEIDIDYSQKINKGVKRCFLAGIGTSSVAMRFIDYEDPESGTQYQFYTSLTDIEPGLVAWLYFKRWTIEKTFDVTKNELNEKKAWATGKNALDIQSHIICLVHNIIRLINEIVQEDMDEDQKTAPSKKYEKWIEKRSKQALEKGREILPMLMISKNRIARICSQFIRCIKYNLHKKVPLKALIPTLKLRLTKLL
tara:strand:- start:21 stop:1322 length:1302 start_codon:yes stop_codon:yes gene_type:complete